MAAHIFENDQILDNRYTVDKFLGEGAFAEVYRVHHRVFGKQAMKVFKATNMDDATIDELFKEPALLSSLRNPNIIEVKDAGLLDTPEGKRGYFTMEYIAGGTLYNYWHSFSIRS